MPNLVPIVLEHTSRGERSYDIYSRLLRWKTVLADIYVTHTDRTHEALRADMDCDMFMTAAEAVTFGLADRVITRRDA